MSQEKENSFWDSIRKFTLNDRDFTEAEEHTRYSRSPFFLRNILWFQLKNAKDTRPPSEPTES